MDAVIVTDANEAKKNRGRCVLRSTSYKTMRYCVERALVNGLLMASLDEKLAAAMAKAKTDYCIDVAAIRREPVKMMGIIMYALAICRKHGIAVRVIERAGIDDDIIVSLLVCMGMDRNDARGALR